MASDPSQQYRAIGGQLALYLRQRKDAWPSTSALQGVAADLVGAHLELALPLKELVGRPAFRALAEKAGSGAGQLERDALLQDLRRTFAPAVVEGLADLLNGLLDLPSRSADPPQEPPQLIPSPAVAIEPAPGATRPLPALTPVDPETRRALAALPAAWKLGLGAVALLGVSMLVLRPSPLCTAFGLCPPSVRVSQRPSALQAASAAEQALRRASSLDGYATALAQLERELLKLTGDPLSPEQQQQRNALQAIARDAHQTLRAERADQEALDRAVDALAAAKASSVAAQAAQLTAVREALAAIPSRSFSAGEASRLREELDALMRQGPPPADPVAPDGAMSAPPVAGPAPVAPSPSRWSAPAPAPQPVAPDRDQPLF